MANRLARRGPLLRRERQSRTQLADGLEVARACHPVVGDAAPSHRSMSEGSPPNLAFAPPASSPSVTETDSRSRATVHVLPAVDTATRAPVAVSTGSSDQSPSSMTPRISSTPSAARSALIGVGVPVGELGVESVNRGLVGHPPGPEADRLIRRPPRVRGRRRFAACEHREQPRVRIGQPIDGIAHRPRGRPGVGFMPQRGAGDLVLVHLGDVTDQVTIDQPGQAEPRQKRRSRRRPRVARRPAERALRRSGSRSAEANNTTTGQLSARASAVNSTEDVVPSLTCA